MNYDELLSGTKAMSKDELKRVVFEVDQKIIEDIKKLNLDKETERKIILKSKDHTWLEMLLINALR